MEATEQRERADDVTAQLSSLQSRAAATQRQLSEDGNLLAAEAAHLEDRLKLLETEREDALAARPPPPASNLFIHAVCFSRFTHVFARPTDRLTEVNTCLFVLKTGGEMRRTDE